MVKKKMTRAQIEYIEKNALKTKVESMPKKLEFKVGLIVLVVLILAGSAIFTAKNYKKILGTRIAKVQVIPTLTPEPQNTIAKESMEKVSVIKKLADTDQKESVDNISDVEYKRGDYKTFVVEGAKWSVSTECEDGIYNVGYNQGTVIECN